MSESLLTYLTRHGGEYMNDPMVHSDMIDTVDILQIRENSQAGAMEQTTLPKLNLAALRSLVNKDENPDNGFVLRIVCIPFLTELKTWAIGLQKQYYDQILDMFGLKEMRDLAHTSPMTFDVLPQKQNGTIIGVKYSIYVSNYIGLYFTYKYSGCAWGVVWSHGDPKELSRIHTVSLIRQALHDFAYLSRDPFYLMFSIIVCLLSSVDQRLARVRKKVAKIEYHTGYQDWGHLYLPEDELPGISVERHLPVYSAEMSGAVTTLASDRRFVRLATEMLAVMKQSKWYTDSSPSLLVPPLVVRAAEDITVIEARIRNSHLLIDILEARVRSQLSAVQNLVARHEMRLSIRIGHDSKTLANSMKILAILTVAFLPATFVASLFSTSMFDWHLSDGDFVSSKFWIYWVISIPLTIFVVFVFVWLNRRWTRKVGGPDEEATRYMLGAGEDGVELSTVDSYTNYARKDVDVGIEVVDGHSSGSQSRL